MAKGKLEKFEELLQMPHVFQYKGWVTPELLDGKGEKVDYKGKWKTDFFKNDKPIVLELACGYGEYTMAMAPRFPEKNFIGIDVKGNRLWTGAKFAIDNKLDNVAFIRTQINFLPSFFDKDEIAEVWIPFPDPHVKEGKQLKRLTSPRFLDIYRQIMPKNAIINLKTDSDLLYEYTLEIIEAQKLTVLTNYFDVYATATEDLLLNVKTRYEKLNLSRAKTIKFLRFQL